MNAGMGGTGKGENRDREPRGAEPSVDMENCTVLGGSLRGREAVFVFVAWGTTDDPTTA